MTNGRSYLAGVIGLAASDLTMYLLMQDLGSTAARQALFWVGAVGALVGYVAWVVWLGFLARARTGTLGRGAVVDGLLIGVSAAATFGLLVVAPQIEATGPYLDQLWLLGCLAADALVLWLVLGVVVTDTSDRKTALIAVGMVLHIVVDVLHSAALGPASPLRMRVGEVLLLVIFALWTLAAFVELPTRSKAGSTTHLAHFRAWSLILAVATPTLLATWRVAPEHRREAVAMLAASIVAGFLAATRIKGLLDALSTTNAKLAYQAHHDQLTGVWNRAAMSQFLADDTSPPLLAVAYLDLDGFKPVNDLFGHEAGDEILVEVARRLTEAIRGSDKVARVGGDEFVILITDHETDVDAFATRLERVLNAQPFTWRGTEVGVGASVGMAEAGPSPDLTPQTLLAHADEAMLKTKHQKKRAGLIPQR